MDWVEAIGDPHEVLHTAVVAHLLRGEQGAKVASALVGMRGIAAVEDVRREQRLNGTRPVDRHQLGSAPGLPRPGDVATFRRRLRGSLGRRAGFRRTP
jgi:hypothetical protein